MSDLHTTQPAESTPMSELIELAVVNGIPTTTSLAIAERFGRRHADVLQTIQKLECSNEFTERNFSLSAYKDSTGRLLPMQHVTKDGFMFLAMGFTGKEAATWKERYIAAFNAMEAKLISQASAQQVPKPDGQQFLSHRADIFVAADRSFRAAMRSGRSAGLKMPQALRRANQIALEKTGVDMLGELRAEDHVADLENRQAHGKREHANQGGAFYRAAPLSAACFWGDWHSGLLGLPYQSCMSEQVYRAYSHWCKQTGEHYPLQHGQFTQALISHCQNKGIPAEVRMVRLEATLAKPLPTAGRMLLVSQPPSEALGVWATELALQFEKHLNVYLGQARREAKNLATTE